MTYPPPQPPYDGQPPPYPGQYPHPSDPYSAPPAPQQYELPQSAPPAQPYGNTPPPPGAPPPGYGPQPPYPYQPNVTPPAKSRGPMIIITALSVVVVMAVVSIGVGIATGFIGGGGGSGGDGDDPSVAASSDEPLDESIKEVFDVDNASYYNVLKGLPTDQVTLSDGTFYPDGSSGDDDHTEVASEPVYTDMDDDGDLDATAILEFTGVPGEDKGWKAVIVWLWESDEATVTRWQASWQWNCVPEPALAIEAGEGQLGISVTRADQNQCGEYAKYNSTETIDVVVADGVPMEINEGHRGTVETCWLSEGDSGAQNIDATGITEPLVIPESDGPEVGDSAEQKAVKVSVSTEWDKELYNGYVITHVTWNDGAETCAWVPWSDLD